MSTSIDLIFTGKSRMCLNLLLVILLSIAIPAAAFAAEDTTNEPGSTAKSVEQLVRDSRDKIVVITVVGRDGTNASIGTGFVIGEDGLIATNLHVIGEARPISVRFADGTVAAVTEILASDRALDLAVVRVDAKSLVPMELGDSDSLEQGQAVVAMGNPRGLEHSVVTGNVSAIREIDGRKFIQLAIPIEPGNSGGPLIDLEGRVHGLLTMKSAVTENLGFAVPINALKPLLEKPNPIAMSRWLTIGALDSRAWVQLFGSNWRQRAGEIQVTGQGAGFGGRTLCVSKKDVPDSPYEVAVQILLEDEGGAAGLVFASNEGDQHYGFYPSAGKLRLTRFDGPDVFAWSVLQEKRVPDYRAGEWNQLKVRHEGDTILCYVNDQLVMTQTNAQYSFGRAGLAAFRGTKARFKSFRIGSELPSEQPDENIAKAVSDAYEQLTVDSTNDRLGELANAFEAHGSAGTNALRRKAIQLEREAQQIRDLAARVHEQQVIAQLVRVLEGDENHVDLVHAALLVSKLDNEELDVDAYREMLEQMAREIKPRLESAIGDEAKLAELNRYLFTENGFHGSRADYYNKSNSYFNELLDDREGLPITLSILYIELAGRIGVHVDGVPFPGHFMVRHAPPDGESQLIDPFDDGKVVTREHATERLAASGLTLQDAYLQPAGKRIIIVRMLNNLLGIARGRDDHIASLRYLNAIVALQPDSVADRGMRSAVFAQIGRRSEAIADLEWVLEQQPAGVDLEQVRVFRDRLAAQED